MKKLLIILAMLVAVTGCFNKPSNSIGVVIVHRVDAAGMTRWYEKQCVLTIKDKPLETVFVVLGGHGGNTSEEDIVLFGLSKWKTKIKYVYITEQQWPGISYQYAQEIFAEYEQRGWVEAENYGFHQENWRTRP